MKLETTKNTYIKMCSSNVARISISKLYTIILILFPLIYSYDLVGISPSLLFCVVQLFLSLMYLGRNNLIIIDKRVWIYLGYMSISAAIGLVLSYSTLYSFIMKMISYTLYFAVSYILSWQVLNYKFAVKLYLSISIILSAFVIIQFIASLLGHGFSMIPPGLRLAGEDVVTSDMMRAKQVAENRFSTIFLEPAHQSEYILPCLALIIFRNESGKKSRDLVIAIFVTVGLICTTSSIGILSSVIMWTYYGFRSMRRRGVSWFIYFLLFLPVIAAIFAYFLSFEFIGENVITRLAVLDYRNTSRTEGFRRIRYGWICYGNLGMFQKLFGLGYKNFGYYLAKTGIGFKLLGTDDIRIISYTNGITGMLIGLGLIGTILNLRLFFFDCIKSKKTIVYGLLLCWGLIMFSSNSFDDVIGVMPMIFAMNIIYKSRGIKGSIKIRV